MSSELESLQAIFPDCDPLLLEFLVCKYGSDFDAVTTDLFQKNTRINPAKFYESFPISTKTLVSIYDLFQTEEETFAACEKLASKNPYIFEAPFDEILDVVFPVAKLSYAKVAASPRTVGQKSKEPKGPKEQQAEPVSFDIESIFPVPSHLQNDPETDLDVWRQRAYTIERDGDVYFQRASEAYMKHSPEERAVIAAILASRALPYHNKACRLLFRRAHPRGLEYVLDLHGFTRSESQAILFPAINDWYHRETGSSLEPNESLKTPKSMRIIDFVAIVEEEEPLHYKEPPAKPRKPLEIITGLGLHSDDRQKLHPFISDTLRQDGRFEITLRASTILIHGLKNNT